LAVAAVIATLLTLAAAPAGVALAAAPELKIEQPVTGSFTKAQTPSFAGTTNDILDPVTLVVYAGSDTKGTQVGTSPMPFPLLGEAWEGTFESPLQPGTYTAVAEQLEIPEPGVSEPVTFTVDTTAPVVEMSQVASPSNNQTPTLTGGAGVLPGDSGTVTVTVYNGSSKAASGAVSANGSEWSYTTPELADGTYTAHATQADAAGNVGESTPVTFVVDTKAPAVSIASVAAFTKDSKPTLTGGAGVLPGDGGMVTVTVYNGSSAGGSIASSGAVAVIGSAWSYTSSGLPDGIYTAQATQEDTAGNLGTSGAVTFTVDTKEPVVSISPVAAFTKSSTPTLTGGAGTLPGDSGTVAVTVHNGSSVGGSVASSGVVGVSGGKWSYTPLVLPDGTYTAQASQENAAGNAGQSAAVTFTVDTKAPVATINPVAAFTKDPTPTLTGVAGVLAGDRKNVVVTIYEGGSAGGVLVESASVPVSGASWSYTTQHLFDAEYTVIATQEDEAGNQGASAAVTFTVNTNAPVVSINPVPSPTNDPTPTLTGGAGVLAGENKSVELTIYGGNSVKGPVIASASVPLAGSGWSYTPSSLVDGTYTARATQGDEAENTGASAPVTFTVDATPPAVTLTSPANSAVLDVSQPTFSGRAGEATGDGATVLLKIYAGASASGGAIQTRQITRSGNGWTTGSTGPSLSNGIFTALVEQSDDAGNVGRSSATFAIAASPQAPAPAPPVASFRWFPSAPHVGEPVSLVSTSTAASNPLAGFAWSLSASGPLEPGSSVRATSFSTPGSHVVRLSVIDANGLSSMVAETIPVTARALVLMQPFPVVRIAGTESSAGVRISLFTVQAPAGAKISVSCHGPGCPAKPQSLVARAGRGRNRAGMILISLRRFEGLLRPGAVLEIRVTKSGQIGKFTRFTVRRHKLPTRVDSCLSAAGVKPIACPSS
jgi:hypothetical protein